ncbi:hypothetical protein [Polymorphospora rubra]|uniref:Uncharacterized protein n=1 Tax=Polymorphospora rubra TaxID=338584 RepID=A0A810MRL8_9ACTN|nr:hypothetical protein [Polymorphospora rubra]BCJ63701.1 hypothetical protein Prubr_07220 [Polymorphospora rubra]
MRGKLWFIAGVAAGFVIGARAGREKYDELVVKGRKVLDHPTVQEAAGVAQAQATRLYSEGKDRLSHTRLGEKLSLGAGSTGGQVDDFAGSSVGSGSTAASTSTSKTSKPSNPNANGSTL